MLNFDNENFCNVQNDFLNPRRARKRRLSNLSVNSSCKSKVKDIENDTLLCPNEYSYTRNPSSNASTKSVLTACGLGKSALGTGRPKSKRARRKLVIKSHRIRKNQATSIKKKKARLAELLSQESHHRSLLKAKIDFFL